MKLNGKSLLHDFLCVYFNLFILALTLELTFGLFIPYLQAQDAKPVAEQKVERPKFAHERVGVFEYQGLTRVSGQLAMRFSLLSEDVEVHNTIEVAPWLLQIGIHKEAVGTELSYGSDKSAALLELPAEETAARWRAYLENIRKASLYVAYLEEPQFLFENGTGTLLMIYDCRTHLIPAVRGFGIISQAWTKLENIKVLVEKGMKTHAVVEWGKAFARDLPGESSNGERYYEINAPEITIYVPDTATQEVWQTRIETERRKLAPHIVLPPAEVK